MRSPHVFLLLALCLAPGCDLFRDEPQTVRRQMIIFASNRGEGDNLNLWMMDLEGNNLRQITHYRDGDVLPADLSPDGTQLLFYRLPDFERNEGFFLMDLDGPEPPQEERLVQAWANFKQGGGNLFPDGRRFVFEDSFTFGIYDLETGRVERIDPGHFGFDPEVSPGGEKICYTVETRGETSTNQIFLMNPDGSGAEAITPREHLVYANTCSFSADGAKVFFTLNGRLSWLDRASGEIHSVPGDEAYGRHPAADTTGARLYYRSPSGLFPEEDAEILGINLDGSGLEWLTRDGFVDEKPVVGVVEFQE